MKPTEIDKIRDFRQALMNFYVEIGKRGQQATWPGHVLIENSKKLLEFYDNLFSADITKEYHEQPK